MVRQRRRKARDLSANCFVYVIATVKDGEDCAPVKVGISDNPDSRFNQIANSSAYPLRLVWAYRMPDRATAVDVEKGFQADYYDVRLAGEWFDLEPYLALEGIETSLQHMWYFGNDKQHSVYLTEWLWKLTGCPPRDDEGSQ